MSARSNLDDGPTPALQLLNLLKLGEGRVIKIGTSDLVGRMSFGPRNLVPGTA